MEILEATVADAAEILALQKSAYLFEAKLYNDYTIPPMTQTLEELAGDSSRETILKAVEDGRIIGSVNGFLKEGRCFIGRLMVHPGFQRQGVGTRLMAAIEAGFADEQDVVVCGMYAKCFALGADTADFVFYAEAAKMIVDMEMRLRSKLTAHLPEEQDAKVTRRLVLGARVVRNYVIDRTFQQRVAAAADLKDTTLLNGENCATEEEK